MRIYTQEDSKVIRVKRMLILAIKIRDMGAVKRFITELTEVHGLALGSIRTLVQSVQELSTAEKYAVYRSIFSKKDAEELSKGGLSLDRLTKIMEYNLQRVGNAESKLCDRWRDYCRIIKG